MGPIIQKTLAAWPYIVTTATTCFFLATTLLVPVSDWPRWITSDLPQDEKINRALIPLVTETALKRDLATCTQNAAQYLERTENLEQTLELEGSKLTNCESEADTARNEVKSLQEDIDALRIQLETAETQNLGSIRAPSDLATQLRRLEQFTVHIQEPSILLDGLFFVRAEELYPIGCKVLMEYAGKRIFPPIDNPNQAFFSSERLQIGDVAVLIAPSGSSLERGTCSYRLTVLP